jgi:hypothetical protein
MMRESTDLWFLRFPDGRVLRAAGTAVLRQQLASGRIPPGTRLRRSLDEEWRSLERYPELADLRSPAERPVAANAHDSGVHSHSTIASRLDPFQLHQVGIRGLLEELLAAVDSTAVRLKLAVALNCGIVFGVLAGLSFLPYLSFALNPRGQGWLLVLGVLLVGIWMTTVLSKLTFSELSRLRPARWADARHDLSGSFGRLLVLQGGLVVFFAVLILAARWLPGFLYQSAGEDAPHGWLIAAQVAALAGILLEGLTWTLMLLLLPLGPLLVVENCSMFAALGRWRVLMRQHLGRLLLAESLALGIAALLCTPLALILVALWTVHPIEPATLAVNVLRTLLLGVAGAVVWSYLIVANVFIYLHLRYETDARR